MVFRLLFEQEAEKAAAAKLAKEPAKPAASDDAAADAAPSSDATGRDNAPTAPTRKSPANES